MKMTIVILLGIFSLFGCNAPQISPQERMTASLAFNYGSNDQIEDFFENIDEYKFDIEKRKHFIQDFMALFGACYTHQYDIGNVERISEVIKKPLSYCKDVTGFSKESWAREITPKGKEFKQWVDDTCSN